MALLLPTSTVRSYSLNAGSNNTVKREMASLTKIMTCVCVVDLCGKYAIDMGNTFFKITTWSASINGTSANLIANFWISVEDLLYGLMLPSGNDAALVLAENMGAVLYFDRMGEHKMVEGY